MAQYVLVTIRTFFATLPFARRSPRSSFPPFTDPPPSAQPPRARRLQAAFAATAGQSGLSLIEVLISSLLVGVIAIGTFTAFDTAGRAGADQRAHAQGGQLARQDQERMRSLTAAELANFTTTTRYEAENGLCVKKEASGKWKYYPKANKENLPFCEAETAFAGQEYTGNVFEVKSSAQYVSAAQNQLACEATGGGANYIKTTSSVRWTTLGATRPAVTQASLITNNTTGLLVKVFDQNHEPLEGATVIVKGSKTSSTQTTPAAGCVIVTGITDTEVKVAVTKLSYVDRASKSPPAEKTVEISPTTAATAEFVIANPGKIEAEFVSQIGGVVTAAGVEGDTFYARQGSITPPPENFVQGTAGTFVKTTTLTPVFPFAKAAVPHEPEAYIVYAGDCEANNPNKVNAAIPLTASNEALVKPGAIAKVKPEVPAVNVTIYEGAATSGPVLTSAEPALLTNSECSAASAQGIPSVTYKRTVAITAAGVLKQKFQPYAKTLSLCIPAKISGKYFKNTFALTNTAKAGTTVSFAMKGAAGTGKVENSATKQTCP
jgi:Tfp pilus assembly protein PilV